MLNNALDNLTIDELFELLKTDNHIDRMKLILKAIDKQIKYNIDFRVYREIEKLFKKITQKINKLAKELELTVNFNQPRMYTREKWLNNETDPIEYFSKVYPARLFWVLFEDFEYNDEGEVINWPDFLPIFTFNELGLSIGFNFDIGEHEQEWDDSYFTIDVVVEKIELVLKIEKFQTEIYSQDILEGRQLKKEWPIIKDNESNYVNRRNDECLFSYYIKPFFIKALSELIENLNFDKLKKIKKNIALVENSLKKFNDIFN